MRKHLIALKCIDAPIHMNICWTYPSKHQASKQSLLHIYIHSYIPYKCLHTHSHTHTYANTLFLVRGEEDGKHQATGAVNDYIIGWWKLATGTTIATIDAIDLANYANSRQKSSNGVTIKFFTIPCTNANPMPQACELCLSSTASNHKNELVHLTVTPRHTETSTPFIWLKCRCLDMKFSMASITVTVTAANLVNAHDSNAWYLCGI